MRPLQVQWGLLPLAIAGMEFINPPPEGSVGDFKRIPAYEMGSVVEVAWTPGPEGSQTSLSLWQLDANTAKFFGNMEYISRKAVGISEFTWIVATAKDLTASNLFFLSIFEEGKSTSDSNSNFFNITNFGKGQTSTVGTTATAATISSSTSSTGSSTGTSSASIGSSTSAIAAAGATTSTTGTAAATSISLPTASNLPDGLTVDAKIGIGVAIPCAVVLVAFGGYMMFRKRRRQTKPPVAHLYDSGNPYNPVSQTQWPGYWGGNPVSVQPRPESVAAKQHQWAEMNTVQDPNRLFELPVSQH